MNKSDFKFEYELWLKFGMEPAQKTKRRMRKFAASLRDRLENPITASFRTMYPDDYTCVEYGIIPEVNWSDDDIREFVENLWVRNRSPYDCTGKLYTSSIHVARIPIGLAYVHRFVLDV